MKKTIKHTENILKNTMKKNQGTKDKWQEYAWKVNYAK